MRAVYHSKFVACWLLVIATASGGLQTPELDQMTFEQVKAALADPNWVLVDTRRSDAFNGWALDGADRGGHFPGAVDFSASWLRVDFDDRKQRLANILKSKGVTRAKNVLLYSVKKSDRQCVAEWRCLTTMVFSGTCKGGV